MSVRSLRYNTIEQHFTKSALASTDRDALAFLEAAQIYNTNQQRAIVNLVRSLKRTGLWSKMKAIYPFVGGTATSHKWNLKDPRDVDAAYRLQFNGGWTHNSDGADPNGTNAYANSYLVPSNVFTLFDSHLSYYSNESVTQVDKYPIGAVSNSISFDGLQFFALRFDTNRYAAMQNAATQFPTSTMYAWANQTTTLGYWINSRTSSTATTLKLFKNGTSIANATTSPANQALNIYSIFIGAVNNRTAGSPFAASFTSARCAFATIGDGLTDTDATNLYNIVDLFQKLLGRAV